MGGEAGILGTLTYWVVVVAIETLVGAMILYVSIGLSNLVLGGADSLQGVPKTSLAKALGITFLTTIVSIIPCYVIGGLAREVAVIMDASETAIQLTDLFVSIAVNMFILAGMLAAMLPATFGRAALLALCCFLIAVVVGAIIGVIIVGFYLLGPQHARDPLHWRPWWTR
jgi:hypothetical protein